MHNHPATTRPLEREDRPRPHLTAQQVFELEREAASHRRRGATLLAAVRALLSPVLRRRPAVEEARPTPARALRRLEGAGCIVLDDMRVPAARRDIDHLVIGPGGVFAVVARPWRGQVAVTGDRLFVDGRQRPDAPEQALGAAAAVQEALSEELRPLGVTVTPVLFLPLADMPWGSPSVQGVAVTAGRGLGRYIRQAPPIMGQDTVVRVALAADRLLESRPRRAVESRRS